MIIIVGRESYALVYVSFFRFLDVLRATRRIRRRNLTETLPAVVFVTEMFRLVSA